MHADSVGTVPVFAFVNSQQIADCRLASSQAQFEVVQPQLTPHSIFCDKCSHTPSVS